MKDSNIVLTFDLELNPDRKHEQNLKSLWPEECLEVLWLLSMVQMIEKRLLIGKFPFWNCKTAQSKQVNKQTTTISWSGEYNWSIDNVSAESMGKLNEVRQKCHVT